MKINSKHLFIAGGSACMYAFAYFLFMPAYEIDRGFDEFETQKNNVHFFIRLTGTQTETGSRILNRIYNDEPYLIQFGVKQGNDLYETARLINFSIYDKTIEKPAYKHETVPHKKFSKTFGSLAIVGYSEDRINLEKENYTFKATFELCKQFSCEAMKFDGTLKYRVKKSFYSNSFANMMGI